MKMLVLYVFISVAYSSALTSYTLLERESQDKMKLMDSPSDEKEKKPDKSQEDPKLKVDLKLWDHSQAGTKSLNKIFFSEDILSNQILEIATPPPE